MKYGVSVRFARSTGFALEAEASFPEKGITVLFGPSGCGKTTLLRCVAGLEHPEGRVVIADEVWQDDEKGIFLPTHSRALGYVFQEASLFPHLNVEENLRFGLKRTKDPRGSEKLAEAVELLGIGHLLKRRVSELSGGERQRCAIARAIAMTPKVLLMDEPLAALDWKRKEEILPWLERLRDELSMPILYVTHSAEEMMRLADRVIAMKDGKIVSSGTLNEVLGAIETPVRRAEGPVVVLDGTVESINERWSVAEVRTKSLAFEVPKKHLQLGDAARLVVAARDVSIALDRHDDQAIRNVLPAEIVSLEADPSEGRTLVTLRSGEETVLSLVTDESVERLQLRPGLSVWLQVKSVAVAL